MTIQSIQADYNNASVTYSKKTVSANEMYKELFEQKLNEQAEIIRNGSTEKAIPLGGTAFTTEEWEKMLADFDVTIDHLREQMRIEHAKSEDDGYEKASEFIKINRIIGADISDYNIWIKFYEK